MRRRDPGNHKGFTGGRRERRARNSCVSIPAEWEQAVDSHQAKQLAKWRTHGRVGQCRAEGTRRSHNTRRVESLPFRRVDGNPTIETQRFPKGVPMTEMNPPIEIDCRAVKARLDEGRPFVFLDCREPEEVAVAKINGTLLIPMSQLAERVGELAARQGDEIIVHCHHGGRSLRVARWLRSQGFSRAASLAGGIDQWALEIDPTITRY
jgi:rhodanese-related sulfurtransferase